MSNILIEVANKIGYVTLSRKPANAFTHEMYIDMAHAIYELGERKDVAIIVLRAEGKIFCGGNDTSAFSSFSNRSLAEDAMYDAIQAVAAVWNCKKPVVAAVNGACMGIGFAIALVSDFIIGGEGVKFGMPEINLGIPAAGCFLQASLPMHVAKRLAFTGAVITSEELEKWGVVMKTVPKDQVWEEADKFAIKMAASCYRAVSVFKQNYNRNVNPNLVEKFMVEQHSFHDFMMNSHDFKEAVDAYNEKRMPVYNGE